jgi:hypothetical protein
MVIRDTQSSRKVDIYGYRGVFFLTFGFKDARSERFRDVHEWTRACLYANS